MRLPDKFFHHEEEEIMSNPHMAFMQQALVEAEAALAAKEFPVGCVLVSGGEIVARGKRRNSSGPGLTELDHAEIMALRALAASSSAPPQPLVVYATMEPCLMCYAALLLNGVRTIVYAYEDVMGGATATLLDRLPSLYQTMAPQIISDVGRNESLALFRRFFNDPANEYWRGSLLARYTLQQEPR